MPKKAIIEIRSCPNCQTEFKVRKWKKKKFCCQLCAGQYLAGRRRGYHESGEWIRECKQCGKTKVFKYKCHAEKRMFCSVKCRDKHRSNDHVKNQYGVRRPWTKEEDRVLRICHKRGIVNSEIGKALSRTENEIAGRVSKLELKRPKEVLSRLYSSGGRKNRGRPRPDFRKNSYVGFGRNNPFYGKKHSKKTRKIISEKAKLAGTFKKLANDPEFQRKRMKGLIAKPNKAEVVLGEILEQLFPGEYRYTGDGSMIIDRLSPDFTNVNGQKKVIELFGETWHKPEEEQQRGARLAQFGYSMLVIWSKEIFCGGNRARKKLEQKIRDFHENRCN